MSVTVALWKLLVNVRLNDIHPKERKKEKGNHIERAQIDRTPRATAAPGRMNEEDERASQGSERRDRSREQGIAVRIWSQVRQDRGLTFAPSVGRPAGLGRPPISPASSMPSILLLSSALASPLQLPRVLFYTRRGSSSPAPAKVGGWNLGASRRRVAARRRERVATARARPGRRFSSRPDKRDIFSPT